MRLPEKLPNWAFWLLFCVTLLFTGTIWVLSYLPRILARRRSR